MGYINSVNTSYFHEMPMPFLFSTECGLNVNGKKAGEGLPLSVERYTG